MFQDTQKKVASLIQWFDKVINETIRKDLDLANNAVRELGFLLTFFEKQKLPSEIDCFVIYRLKLYNKTT